ncbi:tRNA (guanine-N(7)-)-methyltransferase [Spiroplasma clarkii]|nr:tRNA (guanine-N(7)-)-methyltransferase [Spiroplasma clarkii]
MRLRNKNWTKDFIAVNQQYMIFNEGVLTPSKLFADPNKPCYLEIGCGKGQFIINNSLTYPERNFIGMEKETTVIGVALKKALTILPSGFSNLKFLNCYAENLLEIFAPNSLAGIYLNFSDPWPKARHAKKG